MKIGDTLILAKPKISFKEALQDWLTYDIDRLELSKILDQTKIPNSMLYKGVAYRVWLESEINKPLKGYYSHTKSLKLAKEFARNSGYKNFIIEKTPSVTGIDLGTSEGEVLVKRRKINKKNILHEA